MLHALTHDRKTKPESSSKTAEHLSEQEQTTHLLRSRQAHSQQRENLAALQNAYGNQALLRMGRSPATNPMVLQRKCACGSSAGSSGSCAECQSKQEGVLQTKLQIGEPGDRYEQEADRIADQVMRSLEPSVQSQTGSKDEEKEMVQRKTDTDQVSPLEQKQESFEVPPIVHEVLAEPGQSIEPTTRTFFESRFGHHFGNVHIHSDSKAAESAKAVGAQAYTVGRNIIFAEGKYAPGTESGKRLLAHELTHVVQQGNRSDLVQRFVTCEATEDCPQRVTGEEIRARTNPMQIGTVSSTAEGTLIWNFAISSNTLKRNLLTDPAWTNYVSQMNAHPEIRWEILGFTDCQGTEATNVNLRLDRANAVRDALPASVRSRVDTIAGASIGDCISANDTENQRATNRSVLIRQVAEEHDFPEEHITVERPRFVCGPDVTSAVEQAINDTRIAFRGWTSTEKTNACDSLDSLLTGGFAWDIVELHNNSWILVYRYHDCATPGATPLCGSSIQVGNDCYYVGSVNYVIFGIMCRLCYDHFSSIASPARMSRFTRSAMLTLIDYYKGHGFSGLATPAANFVSSQQWAEAGYRGWRSGASQPPGDRTNCRPVCPDSVSSNFHINWYPHMPI